MAPHPFLQMPSPFPCHLLYCLHSPRHFCETVLYLPGLFSTNIFLRHKDHSVCSLHTTACPGQCMRAALGKYANETVQGRTASDGWGLLAAELWPRPFHRHQSLCSWLCFPSSLGPSENHSSSPKSHLLNLEFHHIRPCSWCLTLRETPSFCRWLISPITSPIQVSEGNLLFNTPSKAVSPWSYVTDFAGQSQVEVQMLHLWIHQENMCS